MYDYNNTNNLYTFSNITIISITIELYFILPFAFNANNYRFVLPSTKKIKKIPCLCWRGGKLVMEHKKKKKKRQKAFNYPLP